MMNYRGIVFSKPVTYSGTKRITVEFSPYNDKGDFSPLEIGFKIEKPKNSDTWHVSKRKHAPIGMLHVFDYNYVGSEKSLRKIKGWIHEKMMGTKQNELH